MEGVSYLKDDQNRKTAVVIDLKMLEEHEEDVYDLIDTIIAENRKDDEMIDWEDIKADLRNQGKL